MMFAKNLTSAPISSGTVLFRDGAGNLHITVIVKATYALNPGALAVPAEPLPLMGDTPRDGIETNSLYAASDFAPCKLRADVVVVGRIHPLSPATTRQVVGFALARGPDVLLTKRLVAIGDRARPDAEPSKLAEMPLCWERTWGGPSSPDNPVGCGLSGSASRPPNLVDPEAPRRPVGFGPIAASWPGRAPLLAREHAASLLAGPLTLADDFDLRYFQIAPPDQQLPRLLGGEQLLLIGVHPQHASMVCRLPALHAFARIEGPTTRVRDVPLVGDTLWIDTERSLASVTFRGSVKVATPADAADLLRTTDPWIVHAGMAPCVDVEEVMGAPRAWSLPSSTTATSVDERRSPTVEPIAIHDESGFSVGSFGWSFDPPKSRRIVVVKGTFTLAPEGGKPSISPEQDCLRGDEPAGEGADAEIVASSDYVPFKAKTDVLLRGTAHAPSGRTTALVGLTLGSLVVQLVAIGPRRWDGGGIPGAPGPFEPVPLRWSNAFGGPGFAMNPVGMGLAATASPPLLEDPEHLIRSRSDRPSPACLAPIAPTWPARLALLGSFDRAWQRGRWPYLPADCDTAFFQAAPARLRGGELRGDETFVLDSVRPGGKSFSGALPGIKPRAFALRRGGAPFEVLLRLDTVLFDTDAGRLYLTWRGSFEADDVVSPEIERLVVLRESVDEPRSTADIAAYLAALGEPRLAPHKKENGAASSTGSQTSPKDSAVRLADHLRGGTAVLAAAGIFAARVARAAGAPPAPPPLPAPPTRAQVEALVRDGQSLRGRDFSGADLEGIDLSQQDLEGVLFARARLGGSNFQGAKLAAAKLAGIDAPASIWEGADLSRADLTGAKLVRAVFSRARLEHTSLAGADLTEARLDEVRAESADFSRAVFASGHAEGAILTKADLSYATLASASFRRARLDDAKLHEVTARGAIFDEASLLDARFEKAILVESSFRDAKAAGAVWECADLSGATLHGADVSGAIFAGARLVRADLGGMLARKATFRSADLTQAVLDGSDLMQASFEGACLLGTSLRGTNLYQAEVHQAKLEGADLSKAQIAGTKLAR